MSNHKKIGTFRMKHFIPLPPAISILNIKQGDKYLCVFILARSISEVLASHFPALEVVVELVSLLVPVEKELVGEEETSDIAVELLVVV